MNSIFGIVMESWMLPVKCKEVNPSFMLTLQETLSIHNSMNIPKIDFIAYIYIL